MLLMDVRATLVPVRCRHSPVRACQDRAGTRAQASGEGYHGGKNIAAGMC